MDGFGMSKSEENGKNEGEIKFKVETKQVQNAPFLECSGGRDMRVAPETRV